MADDAPTIDPELETEATEETITVTAEDVAKVAAAAADASRQAWLAALVPLSQYRLPAATEWDRAPNDRVQFAMDQAMVAACERIGRICRSDLEGAGPG